MKRVGIWIDRRKAIVVTIDEGQESRQVFENDEERHPGPEGSRRTGTAYGPQATSLEKQVEARVQLHVVNFYKEVIAAIGKPDSLLVIGPAQAKLEFAEQVEKAPSLRGVKIKVEAADRMEEAQVAERVRKAEF